jgi:hypothetical protein
MWICSTLGFYSLVRKGAEEVHLRARCREDLEALSERVARVSYPHGEAGQTGMSTSLEVLASHPGSDYSWRIILRTDAELALVMEVLAASVTYPNYKSAIAASDSQRDKLDAYHDIHQRMVEWEDGQEGKGENV